MGSPWREPAEETIGLYPHLVVHDGRVSGSITFGRTRLAAAAVRASEALEIPVTGLDLIVPDHREPVGVFIEANERPGDPLDEWREAAITLVWSLLNQRGEFARLLLTIANAERLEGERRDRVLDEATGGEGGLVNITPGDPEAVQLPPGWEEDPDLYGPVVDQLRRCLAVLDPGPQGPGSIE